MTMFMTLLLPLLCSWSEILNIHWPRTRFFNSIWKLPFLLSSTLWNSFMKHNWLLSSSDSISVPFCLFHVDTVHQFDFPTGSEIFANRISHVWLLISLYWSSLLQMECTMKSEEMTGIAESEPDRRLEFSYICFYSPVCNITFTKMEDKIFLRFSLKECLAFDWKGSRNEVEVPKKSLTLTLLWNDSSRWKTYNKEISVFSIFCVCFHDSVLYLSKDDDYFQILLAPKKKDKSMFLINLPRIGCSMIFPSTETKSVVCSMEINSRFKQLFSQN